MQYNHKQIEEKWQQIWEESGIYKDYSKKKKFYALDMFPYPSGAGLHVGHPKGYIATDVYARFMMMNGYSVLHPMGWDAFGLPAENYAIENKIHPKIAVEKNIATFKKQLLKFGFTYDWDREINTTDPAYYKWTQWIFLKMFERGLAYQSDEPINWCPKCKTGLALEDLEGGYCERCGTQVVQKKMRQWVLKMTDYADRLLYDLGDEDLDWEEPIKEQQRNWIGRSEGAIIKFPISNFQFPIDVFTTRVDTIYGCTYVVVAPEHEVIGKLKDKIENYDEVEKYLIKAQNKTELERMEMKEKTGVELKGIKVINPFNKEEIPLFVADYVLGHYGTGAVMAVPAHDERDYEFAKKYNLPIKQSVAKVIDPMPKDAARKGREAVVRKYIFSIIKHWDKNEFYCLDWEKFGWASFIIGGVNEGETEEQAAFRESKEESGYKNLRLVKKVDGKTFSSFYAAHKYVNRFGEVDCFYFELADGEFSEPDEEHVKNHKGLWVKEEEVAFFINLPNHLWYWEILKNGEKAFTEDGIVVNSGEFTGMISDKAREKMTQWLEKNKLGRKKVNYKMRDWVFSRQRYWGEPIPVIYCEECKKAVEEYKKQNSNFKEKFSIFNFQFSINGKKFSLGEFLNPGWIAVAEDNLPVKLPDVESYLPTGTGEGPLINIKEWVNTKCPKCGGAAKRETNTMPQWAGSSWYYLAYLMRGISNFQFPISKYKKEFNKWLPVDLYVGGAEHATRHLLYARFWHKFLYDIGVVSTKEPFKRLIHVGLILAEDGRKMSKRWDNVINPDNIIEKFGADSIRLYEMFMGPFTQNIAWSTEGVKGVRRFLDRTWDYLFGPLSSFIDEKDFNQWVNGEYKVNTPHEIKILLNKTIKKVTEDIENFRFNTAISQLMILRNSFYKKEWEQKILTKSKIEGIGGRIIEKSDFEKFVLLLTPFVPHFAEELWEKLGHKESIFKEKWPEYDKKLIKDETINLVIQVNGKVRDTINVPTDISEDEAKKIALESAKIKKWIEGKEIIKIIFVKGRLLNIVV